MASIKQSCKTCGHDIDLEIPHEEVELFKKCGLNFDEDQPGRFRATREYIDAKLNNSWFYSWFTTKCDLCGEDRVLGWLDGCSPSGEHITFPSEEMNIWPTYTVRNTKLRICGFCLPDYSKPDTEQPFCKKLIPAIENRLTSLYLSK